jgi:hypothetical protein
VSVNIRVVRNGNRRTFPVDEIEFSGMKVSQAGRRARVQLADEAELHFVGFDVSRNGRKTRISRRVKRELALTRLNLADAISTADPGSRLSSALVDLGEGSGIKSPLTGSWGSTDWSGAYPYAMWNLNDLFGRQLGGNYNLSIPLYIRLRTTQADTDDFAIGLAVVNESVLTGATVDGKGIQIVGNGAGGSGSLRTGNVDTTNGSGTVSNASSSVANLVWAAGFMSYAGIGASRIYVNGSLGLNSSGAAVGGGTSPITALTLAATPSSWYLAAFFGRNDATNAGTLPNIAADFYVGPIVRSPLAVG